MTDPPTNIDTKDPVDVAILNLYAQSFTFVRHFESGLKPDPTGLLLACTEYIKASVAAENLEERRERAADILDNLRTRGYAPTKATQQDLDAFVAQEISLKSLRTRLRSRHGDIPGVC
ncbi:MAG: antitoxin VbhA family protein [Propionibacteriaceae bacterium]